MSRGGAIWLIPFGLLLLAGGIAALIGAGNEDAVNWLKDNATCNERPCTYSEAESILTGVGVVGTAGGAVMTLFGLWRLLRGPDSAPTISLPQEADAAPESERGYGFSERHAGNSPAERLARLDAELAAGKLELSDYLRMREKILAQM